MNVELILRIAAVGILAAVLHLVLTKAGRDDVALAVSLAALAIVMVIVIRMLGEVLSTLQITFGLDEW